MKYRIDFSRLARNEAEVLKQKQVEEFLSMCINFFVSLIAKNLEKHKNIGA